MRVVLDTNVTLAAVFWQGNAWRILESVRAGLVVLCATDAMIAEFARVVAYEKFASHLERINKKPNQLVEDIKDLIDFYPDSPEPLGIISADPSDDMFLACALTAEAEYIISGDKHLLDLKNFVGIPILTPRQFLKRFHDMR